jgi:beta-phosphoglucomutase family hydrolase
MDTGDSTNPPGVGVIFDMNGTIVDDAGYQRNAWKIVCARHGRVLSDQEYNSHVAGHKEADVLAYIFGADFAKDKGAVVAEEKRRMYRESFDPVDAEMPGLRGLLNEMESRGIRLGLATSASQSTMDFILDSLDVRRFFQRIVQANEVARGKPNPDIYLLAAREIGVAPSRCLVMEDSSAGVRSAKAAGMRCVGIATTLSVDDLLSHGADRAIGDFTEISVNDILSLISSS